MSEVTSGPNTARLEAGLHMGDTVPNSQPAPAGPPASERLESWKDIAGDLDRTVRTVQRWEKTEDLPVYRHVHNKRGSVYIYKTELEAWWNNRRPHAPSDTQSTHRQATSPGACRRLGRRLVGPVPHPPAIESRCRNSRSGRS